MSATGIPLHHPPDLQIADLQIADAQFVHERLPHHYCPHLHLRHYTVCPPACIQDLLWPRVSCAPVVPPTLLRTKSTNSRSRPVRYSLNNSNILTILRLSAHRSATSIAPFPSRFFNVTSSWSNSNISGPACSSKPLNALAMGG